MAETENFSAAEREAMKERAREAKAEAKRQKGEDQRAADLADVLGKIEAMAPADRAIAERIHELVLSADPELLPRTWYGMPAYAKDGKVVCFFQDAGKFKARYSTLGFQDPAMLDDGVMWPTSYALTGMDAAAEQRIVALVKQAAGN